MQRVDPADLTFIVLAAGLGRRFGGLKQLAPVGPGGRALLDLTIADARKAGFGRVILVVRREVEEAVVEHVRRFAPPDLSVLPVLQDGFGPPRRTPWGTAHAVLACAAFLDGPFAVANADDLYGEASLRFLARHLRAPGFGPGQAAIVGYRVDRTLSVAGGVTRGVCRVDGDGRLLDIEEQTGVRRTDGRVVSDQAENLASDTVVSMNLWGFHPFVLDRLARQFDAFSALHAADDTELRLPDVVAELVHGDRLTVTVLPTDAPWHGITYAEDVERVRAALAEGP